MWYWIRWWVSSCILRHVPTRPIRKPAAPSSTIIAASTVDRTFAHRYRTNTPCTSGIGVGDEGQGHLPKLPSLQKIGEKLFFGEISTKIREFCYFSVFYRVKFVHFVNSSYIYFRAKCLPLKVDWAPIPSWPGDPAAASAMLSSRSSKNWIRLASDDFLAKLWIKTIAFNR